MTNGEAPKAQSTFSGITIKAERERHQVLVQMSAVPKQSFWHRQPIARGHGQELQTGSNSISTFRSCVVHFWAGRKTEESLQKAHVEGITVTHWIYHEHIEKKLFNADTERQCDVFCSYSRVAFLCLSALIQILLKSIAVLPFRRIMPLNSYFRKCTLLGDNTKQKVDD